MPASDGLALIVAAAAAAALGAALYMMLPSQRWRQRAAVQAVLAYGALLGLVVTAIALVFHVHELVPFELHVHDPDCVLAGVCMWDAALAAIAAGLAAPGSAFLTAQLSLRGLLREMEQKEVPEQSQRVRELSGLRKARVLVVDEGEGVDAFCFALLRWGRPWVKPRGADTVVLTRRLVERLPKDEIVAIVMHEVAHLRALDGRYAPFLKTLRRIVFFDPLLRRFVRRVEESQEFEADRWAAAAVGQPFVLARALVDAQALGLALRSRRVPGLGSCSGLLEERVGRLLEMQEQMVRAVQEHKRLFALDLGPPA